MKLPLSEWVTNKIINALVNHEGFATAPPELGFDLAKVIVQDAFGYRYEVNIEVKAIGRTAALYTETSGKDKELWMPE